MIGQRGVRGASNPSPIRYDALDTALAKLAAYAKGFEDACNDKCVAGISVTSAFHMPRIGCGLAGGEWCKVEALLIKNLAGRRIVVYDLP